MQLSASILVEEAERRVAAEHALAESRQRVAELEAQLQQQQQQQQQQHTQPQPPPRVEPAPLALEVAPAGSTAAAAAPPASLEPSPREGSSPLGSGSGSAGSRSPRPLRSVSTCSLEELRSVASQWSVAAQQAVQISTLPRPPSPVSSPTRQAGITPLVRHVPRGRVQPIPSAVLRTRAYAGGR
jgi:Tfp pilus assembly protein FimV